MSMLRSLLLQSIGLVLFPSAVLACECLGISVEDAFKHSDMVFVAKVIGRDAPAPRRSFYHGDSVYTIGGGDMIRWKVIPSRGWRGEPPETLAVYSSRDEAACGYVFELGREYLVYAKFMNRDGWWFRGSDWPQDVSFPVAATFLCDRTARIERCAADLRVLDEPTWTR